MLEALAPYAEFARVGFVNILAFRLRYFTGIITYLLNVTVYYFIWSAVYRSGPVDRGLQPAANDHLRQRGLDHPVVLLNTIDQEMAYEVIEGKIAMDLIKPVSMQWMWICRAIGESAFRLGLLDAADGGRGGASFSTCRRRLRARISCCSWPAVLGSFFLMGAINFMIGTCAIPLKSILALIRAKFWLIELLSGLLIPMTFFPEKARAVLAWLPFEHIAYTPLQIYLGKLDRTQALQRARQPNGSGWWRCWCSRICGGIAACAASRSMEARLCAFTATDFAHDARSADMPASLLAERSPACASLLRLLHAIRQGARQLSRRFLHQPDHQFCRHDLWAWPSSIVLFQKVPQLAGWRFEEVLFLYGFSLIPYGIFNVISANLYDFGNNYIIEGKFDRVLLRPISSLFQILFETFRIESLQEVATGLFCMAWASVPSAHCRGRPGKSRCFCFSGSAPGSSMFRCF